MFIVWAFNNVSRPGDFKQPLGQERCGISTGWFYYLKLIANPVSNLYELQEMHYVYQVILLNGMQKTSRISAYHLAGKSF